MPTVSVIIPTYKRAHLVSETIESVLAQTYTDYEIIVVNDGSTDNTKEVLASFGDKITAIHQENKGVSAARNTGIIASQGRYIAFLDDDDLWLPNKLEKQIAFLESHSNIGWLHSDAVFFNEKGFYPQTFAQVHPILPFEQNWSIFVRNYILLPTVVVRRESLDEVGLFDETLMVCEDLDLWLRISEKYPLYFLNEILLHCRTGANGLSRNKDLLSLNGLRVQEKALSRNPQLQKLPLMVLDAHFYNLYLNLAYSYIQRYQTDKARQLLERYRQLRGITCIYEWMRMISFPILNSAPTSDSVPAFTNK